VTTVERWLREPWCADLKAEALARWVSGASEQRLRSVIHSRLRTVLLWQIFRTICHRAQPDIRLNAVVEFRIGGRRGGGIDCYRLTLAGGRCRRSRRGRGTPKLTLELEPVAFLRLVSGAASPSWLVITGQLKLRGDLKLAVALPTALRLPKRRPRASARNR
jgi:hypothetical protein